MGLLRIVTMNFTEILAATLILFSVIDIVGNIPIIIDMKEKGVKVEPTKVTLVSLFLMIAFLYGGEGILRLLGLDVQSFAIAGALILFFIGLEMILGVRFFKDSGSNTSSNVVPIAFPLIAGAGTMTTLIALKSNYKDLEILSAILINGVIIFVALYFSDFIKSKLGDSGTSVLRKVFGIILLAIAIKLFKENFYLVITPDSKLGFLKGLTM